MSRFFHYDRESGEVVEGRTPHEARGAQWPMPPCLGSGVAPSQAQELRDFFDRAGCSTEVTESGDPVYRTSSHRKKALKARGLCDKSAFC